MHEQWTDRLSEYLDGELTDAERAAVDAHLRDCASCRAVLDDLRAIVTRARTLEPRPPHADLWPGVAGRIEARRSAARRVSFTMPQALAASVAIALLSGAIVWQALGRPEGLHYRNADTANAAADAPTAAPTGADAVPVSLADAQYDAAVADLEKALKEGRGRLDKSTITVVEHNLQIIDQAIEQARQALDADPANNYLSDHLVEARRRKLDLLRRAAALSQGD